MVLEKYGWDSVDMLWCQGPQNIGLFNHKLNSWLKCTVWLQCTSVPDRQTDEHQGNSATNRYNKRIAPQKCISRYALQQ